MQVQDCFDAVGEKIKVGDTVWGITTPLKVLKIVSQKEYAAIEREKYVQFHLERKEEYKVHFAEYKERESKWLEDYGTPYPRGGWINASDFDNFEDYWKHEIDRRRNPKNPPEFPENKIPMLYLSFFQRENSMECYGFWREATYVYKDPTKIPMLFNDTPIPDLECDLEEIKKEFMEMDKRIEEQSYIKRKNK